MARVCLAFLVLSVPAFAREKDTIIFNDGKELPCTVTRETVDKIRIREQSKEFDAATVRTIVHNEPVSEYQRAMGALRAGRFTRAAKGFEEARGLSGAPEWVKPYATFYLGESYRASGLADRGRLGDAISAYEGFLRDHSSHFLIPSVRYGLGEAHRQNGDASRAEEQYKNLAEGTFGERWRLRGKYGLGLINLRSNPRAALSEFEIVSGAAANQSGMMDLYRLAIIGKGQAYMEQKQYPDAIGVFRSLIDEGGSEQDVAGAYNRIAKCYLLKDEGQGAKIQALHEYLTVIVRYPGAREEYAEALFQAHQLSKDLGMSKRAEELKKELKARCPESEQAQKL